MKLIGLTGGIGSGKTYCAGLFEHLGIPVYNADREAKRLMNENQKIRKDIVAVFGEEAYTNDGQVNRTYLAKKVFGHPTELEKLNKLIHPVVRQDFIEWGSQQVGHPYIIQESAILFETGSYKFFDKVILVDAPRAIRIERVTKRDGINREAVEARMKHQWSSEKKRFLADYVIDNDGSSPTLRQVFNIHMELIFLT